ncbi:MAG TPA: ATP-binding protein [Vicinamibacteria bacterium]|nr:ATP-binding protein [Vicinamibacteria bacterium]
MSAARGQTGGRRERAAPPRRPAAAARPDLALVVPSETHFLVLIKELTKRMAEAAGFAAGVPDRVALAVDEAATNVIEHAYHGATDRTFEVRYENRDGTFQVEVVDTGAMVDPRAMPRVDLDRYVTERRTGGLGVHLMEKIMDSVTFQRSARRNVCRLVKRKD